MFCADYSLFLDTPLLAITFIMELQKPKSYKKSKSKRIIAEQELKVDKDVGDLGTWEDLTVQASQLELLYPSAPSAPTVLDPAPIVYPSKPMIIMDQIPLHYQDFVKQKIEPTLPPTTNIELKSPGIEEKDALLENLFVNEVEQEFNHDFDDFRSNLYRAEVGDVFYERLLVYEQYNKELHVERTKLNQLNLQIEATRSRFWMLSKFPVIMSEKCPDGILLTHAYSNEQASFSEMQKAELISLLDGRRRIVYLTIPKCMYLAQSAKIWIDNHLNAVFVGELSEILNKKQKKSSQIIDFAKYETQFKSAIDKINTLFIFETRGSISNAESDKRLLGNIRNWITQLSVAISLSGYQAYVRRVLLYILRTPGVGAWSSPVFYFELPTTFSEVNLSHYLICLKAFLGPVQELQELLESREIDKVVEKFGLKELESEDWIVVDDVFTTNSTELKVVLLKENDYEVLIKQFNIIPILRFFLENLFTVVEGIGITASLECGAAVMKLVSVCYHFIRIIFR